MNIFNFIKEKVEQTLVKTISGFKDFLSFVDRNLESTLIKATNKSSFHYFDKKKKQHIYIISLQKESTNDIDYVKSMLLTTLKSILYNSKNLSIYPTVFAKDNSEIDVVFSLKNEYVNSSNIYTVVESLANSLFKKNDAYSINHIFAIRLKVYETLD